MPEAAGPPIAWLLANVVSVTKAELLQLSMAPLAATPS
jgi:hypothetical protein